MIQYDFCICRGSILRTGADAKTVDHALWLHLGMFRDARMSHAASSHFRKPSQRPLRCTSNFSKPEVVRAGQLAWANQGYTYGYSDLHLLTIRANPSGLDWSYVVHGQGVDLVRSRFHTYPSQIWQVWGQLTHWLCWVGAVPCADPVCLPLMQMFLKAHLDSDGLMQTTCVGPGHSWDCVLRHLQQASHFRMPDGGLQNALPVFLVTGRAF